MQGTLREAVLLIGLLVCLPVNLLIGGTSAQAPSNPHRFVFKLYIEEDGIYRIGFDDLDYGGQPILSENLTINAAGIQIPIWVNDGGDGLFGAGDHLVFNGHHLGGAPGHYSETSRYNVYWLTAAPVDGRGVGDNPRMQPSVLLAADNFTDPSPNPSANSATHLAATSIPVRRRLERNLIRVAIKDETANQQTGHGSESRNTESWYWHRLSHQDSSPFRLDVTLGGHESTIRVGVTGLSNDRHAAEAGLAQHRIELRLNGHLLAWREWDGQATVELQVHGLDPSLPLETVNRLEVSIPRRLPDSGTSPIIDLSLLNWIEISQPFDGVLTEGQLTLDVRETGQTLRYFPVPGSTLFAPSGRRIVLNHDRPVAPAGNLPLAVQLDETGDWIMVADGGYLSPTWIIPDSPSDYASKDHQADYLIIAHASLLQVLGPLAELHQNWGLNVETIDIDDVYDEFADGVPAPGAIREFIRHTHNNWQAPAPRFVLFVGDAAWNIFSDEVDDETFARRALHPAVLPRPRRLAASLHAEQIAQRNLVPTLQVRTHDDFAASDNGLVLVDDTDWLPDVAVGRLPVAYLGELEAVLEKLLSYAEQADVGPWRRRIAWVSDSTPSFQQSSTRLAASRRQVGLIGTSVYPPDGDISGQNNPREPLLEAFNSGHLLVHFLGHGGRFVWRTGPPNYRHGTDMFSVIDLPGLAPSKRLPMVLSMTCSSGPFDHPVANSMAEAMLLMPRRAAIAVLAASWRVTASFKFSSALTTALTEQRIPIGEAIMRAKRMETNPLLVESYNLLGDPAMMLAVPQIKLALQMETRDGITRVTSPLDLGIFEGGEMLTDWLDSDGQILKSDHQAFDGSALEVRYDHSAGGMVPDAALIYVWQSEARIDAVGSVGSALLTETPAGLFRR